jgi:hypothetical protein
MAVYWNSTMVSSIYMTLNDNSVKKFGSNAYAQYTQQLTFASGIQPIGLYGYADEEQIYSIGFITMNITCA